MRRRSGFLIPPAGKLRKDKDFLTPQEASRYLRLSLKTLHNFIQSGELEAHKKGNELKIERSQLESFAEFLGEREEFPEDYICRH